MILFNKGNTYIYKNLNILRTYMENVNIKRYSTKINLNISNRQSAGVHAPQRINAKELWYILGIIEANGSFSCYKEKDLITAELVIGIQENDIKLLYWIRSILSYGTVKKVKHNSPNCPDKLVARYIIRSKIFIEKYLLAWFELYPPLTINKTMRIKYIKDCLIAKQILLQKAPIKQPQDCNITSDERTYPDNLNLYFKDWIIGFIEGNGSFDFVNRDHKRIAEFNLKNSGEEELLNRIAKEMGFSLNISTAGVLTAVFLTDIQAVIDFMYDSNRIRLKGLKKVKFLSWVSELRTSRRYSGIKIPFKY